MFKNDCLILHHDLRKSVTCGVEQLAARWAHNPKVVCSSQASATRENQKWFSFFIYLHSVYIRMEFVRFLF